MDPTLHTPSPGWQKWREYTPSQMSTPLYYRSVCLYHRYCTLLSFGKGRLEWIAKSGKRVQNLTTDGVGYSIASVAVWVEIETGLGSRLIFVMGWLEATHNLEEALLFSCRGESLELSTPSTYLSVTMTTDFLAGVLAAEQDLIICSSCHLIRVLTHHRRIQPATIFGPRLGRQLPDHRIVRSKANNRSPNQLILTQRAGGQYSCRDPKGLYYGGPMVDTKCGGSV